MEPRAYQTEAVKAILAARLRGIRRALLVMATGCGKTQCFVWLIARMRAEGETRPALIVAHREELLTQAANRVRSILPEARVGIERAESRVELGSADVIVASVQTIGAARGGRLEWLAPGLVIIDEAHHVAQRAKSYMNVVERFAGECFLLGVTATPKRLDRLSLHAKGGGVFEEVVFDYGIRKAIDDGWLCPLRGYRVQTKVDLSSVRTTAGDFNQAQLSDAVEDEDRTEDAVLHWQRLAAGRPTIAFGASVAHAEQFVAAFRAHGVSAESVDGSMDRDVRSAILGRYLSGETTVLANCQIATEGFDAPKTSCILMARPTQSWGLYVQCIGRGTRLAPGKEDCIIIDVVDLTTRHDLCSVPSILDLPAGLDLEGRTLSEAAQALEELGAAAGFLKDYAPKTFSELQTVLQQIDLFRRVEPAPEVRQVARLAWLSVLGGYYVSCGGGDRREARLERDALGNWRLRLSAQVAGRREVVDETHWGQDTPRALRASDAAVLGRWPDARWVASINAPWRKEPASERQRATLRSFGYSDDVIATLDKGAACGIITQRFAGARR